jgi:hypothetical protein
VFGPESGLKSPTIQDVLDPCQRGHHGGETERGGGEQNDVADFGRRTTGVQRAARVAVNRETVNDFTEPADVTGNRRISRGTVAIQAHDPESVIHFRNIELKLLPES